eukprot:scaffold33690_cov64-Phaeocystis_antarctica.AAC.1
MEAEERCGECEEGALSGSSLGLVRARAGSTWVCEAVATALRTQYTPAEACDRLTLQQTCP